MHQKFKEAINFHKNGELKKANDICLEILKEEPNNFDILHLVGIIAFQNKNYKTSAALLNKAIKINPNNADAHNNHATALKKLNRLDEAITSWNHAIIIRPDFIQAYNNRAYAMVELNRLDSAIEDYNKVIQIRPNLAEAYNNLGNVLNKINKFNDAIKNYDQAILINPDYAEAYYNRGTVQQDLKLYEEAHESYTRAIKIKPNLNFLMGSLIYTKLYLCDWTSFYKNLKILEKMIIERNKSLTPFSSLLFYNSSSLQKKVVEIYLSTKYNFQNINKLVNKNFKKNKIRIGYYSADFRQHVMSDLLIHLFQTHDKSKFELIGFSFNPGKPDDMHYKIKKSFDKFFDVSLKTDKEVAQLSADQKVDIAVDLMGFTTHNRIGIFIEPCAPIKVNFLGYPGTLGSNHDYIIADKILIPEKNQKNYSEKIVYLPDSYKLDHSNRKISNKIFTKEELGLPKNSFVYCCFNNNFKITPYIFNIWMNILKAVKNSVLWLMIKENNLTIQNNLKKEALKRGISSDRLIFANRMPLSDHLTRLKLADLFIDTMPYNAHTTASDGLWVGLPVLTLCGESFASRVAASMLNAIELNELVAYTDKEYEELAIELATNQTKLKEIKNKLDKNKITKPLFNTKLFAKNIELAYTLMYEKHLNNTPPENIKV